MDWRESLLRRCGPGLLGGITFAQWLDLLRKQEWDIDLARLPRAVAITTQSLRNSLIGWIEHRRFESRINHVVLQPPLFVLGHWRSGTTHLHQLLAQDPRFAFPNTIQTSFPHTFLTTEKVDAKILRLFFPKHRPMDNMDWHPGSPQEEEFALCVATLLSPCMGWVFPRRRQQFARYLTFQQAQPEEVARWQTAFIHFLKKLQWRYPRPLVLKSPPHTARIGLLLQLFPNARFVHIHRDPYRVFQSTRHTLKLMLEWQSLHRPRRESLDDWVIEQYREMYEAFFKQKTLVASHSFHELSFEALNRDPIAEVRRLYQALSLPDFEEVAPKLRDYVASLSGFRKNTFPDLDPELKLRLGKEWGACFDAWGYER